ncbi:MAG TPA: 2-succinyl-6-hydroxy-2,4-cyclohexadiene-1-carboxylate synthase [Rhodothermales bacterium]|nr:2-succinyl-6-hydroxy-2,4-cyclohexadiene-1-carboxylate synthase [Rhodothermales bacterium]
MPEAALLHHIAAGDPSRSTVVLLHGFMGSSADWKSVIQHLASSYHCLAVDLPGHGASSVWPASRFTMAATAEALVDVLYAHHIDSCSLVGYSMGGRLALYFALRYPHRCGKLLLESTSPGLKTAHERAARRKVDEQRAVCLETEDFDEFVRDWYAQALFSSLAQHEGLAERMIAARQRNDPRALAQSLRGMGTGQQSSLWERLAALQVPTLAVAGALDAKYVDIARQMKAASDQIQMAIVPEAGHNVHAEQPASFLDLLIRFL